MRILVIADVKAEGSFLKKALTAEGHDVTVASDDVGGYFSGPVHHDAAVLACGPPPSKSLEALKCMRTEAPSLLSLVVIPRDSVQDRVRALDLGADDCLSQPFSVAEMCARVRALSRRGPVLREGILVVSDLQLDRVHRTVRRAGLRIDLTPKEFALLEYLMLNAGRAVTRPMIINQVWGYGFDPSTNVVDVYVYYLRRAVERGFGPKLIHTVRGVGYQVGGELPD